jgi:hypothetical protein
MTVEERVDPITAIYLGYGILRDIVKGADNTLKTFETAASLPGRARQLYSHVSATSFGQAAEQRLRRSRPADLVQVGPGAFVNNTMREVTNLGSHQVLADPAQLTRLFKPLTQATSERMFSSQVTTLPSASATENPWQFLHDPRPLDMVSGPPSADHVPVIFEHGGMPFVGWQMRGALPQLFGIAAGTQQTASEPDSASLAGRVRQRLAAANLADVSICDQQPLPPGILLVVRVTAADIYVANGYYFFFSSDAVRIVYDKTGLFKAHRKDILLTFDQLRNLSMKSTGNYTEIRAKRLFLPLMGLQQSGLEFLAILCQELRRE